MNPLPINQPQIEGVSATAQSDDPIPRRILMVAACPFPANRGTPARILRMSEALASRGHEVHVATYHLGASTDEFPMHVHRIARVPTYRKMDPGPSLQKLLVLDPLLAVKVTRLAKQLQPDIIHAHHYEGLLVSLPAKKLFSIPIVFDAHVLLDGELDYYKTGIPTTMLGRIARSLDRRLPPIAAHTVAVSDEIRDVMIAQHACEDQMVTVVANGVEAEFFEGNPDRFAKSRSKRLLFTGNLATYQGTGSMLQALAIVCAKYEDVSLTIITNSDTTDFMEEARRIGIDEHIEFVDCSIADLPDMIASADVALNPRTRCPGVPQKLLNYMAGAAPIVSFEGSAKYIKHNESGLVVEDDNIDEFANGVLCLLHNQPMARELGRTAQLFARVNLNWELNAIAVEQVYGKIIDDRARQSA